MTKFYDPVGDFLRNLDLYPTIRGMISEGCAWIDEDDVSLVFADLDGQIFDLGVVGFNDEGKERLLVDTGFIEPEIDEWPFVK